MALSCQVSVNYASYTAGQNPPPMATVFVYNPGASTVTVTAVNMKAYAINDSLVNRVATLPSVPPIGQGMTTSVGALSSITIGPFPLVFGMASNANSFQAVNQTGNLNPTNPQIALRPQVRVMVGALVYGSDGSVNEAGVCGILVSYATPPPLGFQGGFLQFSSPNNCITGFMGVL